MKGIVIELRTASAGAARPAFAGLAVALHATLVTLVLTGIVYPLAVTGIAQVVFPHRANGSIATDDKGREVGPS